MVRNGEAYCGDMSAAWGRNGIRLFAVAALFAAACSSKGPAEVPVAQATSGTIDESVLATGSLAAKQSWPLTAPSPGKVAELFVRNGDQVEAGQPVMRIDSPLVEGLLAQSRSSAADAAEQCSGGVSVAGISTTNGLGGTLSTLGGALGALMGIADQAQGTLAGLIPPGLTLGTGPGSLDPEALRKQLETGLVDNLTQALGPQLDQSITEAFGDALTTEITAVITDLMGKSASNEFASAIASRLSEALGATFSKAISEKLTASVTEGLGGEIGKLVDQAVNFQVELAKTSMAGLQGLGASLEPLRQNFTQALGGLATSVMGVTASAPGTQPVADAAQGLACTLRDATGSTVLAAQQAKNDLVVKAPAAGTVVLGDSGGANGTNPLDSISGLLGGALPLGLGDLGALGGGGSSRKRFSVGTNVGVGEGLLTVYDMGGFLAVADFEEAQVIKLVTGAPAEVRLEALGRTIPGTLTFVTPNGTSSGSTPRFEAEVTLEPSDASQMAGLLGGMVAQITINLNKIGPGTVVRDAAIVRDDEAASFLYVIENGKAKARKVQIIGSDGVFTAVTGVKAGDEVVLSPRTVTNGQSVKGVARNIGAGKG